MRNYFKTLFLSLFGLFSLFILTGCLLLLLPLGEPLSQKVKNNHVVITNVNIIDAINEKVINNQDVYIQNGEIQQITNATQHTFSNVTIIEGTGKFLMPSLWDMHSHLAFDVAPQLAMPMYLAYGVTGLRDMQGVMIINSQRQQWKKSINDGELLGPKIIARADEIVGDNYDERNVTEVVERVSQASGSFIKIYSGIQEPRYLKLANEAKQKNVTFAGHYPLSIDPILSSQAGQKSFEHAHLFIDNSSILADEIRAYHKEGNSPDITRPSRKQILDSFSYDKFNLLVKTMIENNTYFCPTHVTKNYEASVFDENYLNSDKKDYVPFLMEFMWNDDAENMKRYDEQLLKRFHQRGLELTGIAHDKGVKILAGTDTFDPYSVPGITLHEELAQLVAAGLTPGQAIVSATVNPADYFGLGSQYGSVEEGKIADLLLLTKNPLENIENTKEIDTLFFNQAIYSHSDLSGYKEYVKDNVSGASGAAMSIKMLWGLFRDNNPEARQNAHLQTD